MSAERDNGPVGIEADLSRVSTGVEDLCELASDPEGSLEGARIYDFNVRWGTLVSGRLRRLEHYYRAGELSRNQEQNYRKLRSELREAMPRIEALGVTRSAVPLED